MMIPRKKPKPTKDLIDVQVASVADSVVEAVTPSWSAVASQWATAASAIAVAITLLGNIWMDYQRGKQAAEERREAAIKVEEVKQALQVSDAKTEGTLEEIKATTQENQATGEATHTLVNANYGAQLKISALALRRIAAITKDPDDVAAAELAEKLLKEHNEKQKTVDDKKD